MSSSASSPPRWVRRARVRCGRGTAAGPACAGTSRAVRFLDGNRSRAPPFFQTDRREWRSVMKRSKILMVACIVAASLAGCTIEVDAPPGGDDDGTGDGTGDDDGGDD